jgi:hypothetical protein
MSASMMRREESPRTPPPSSASSLGTCPNALTTFPVHEDLSEKDLTLSRLSVHSEAAQLKRCRPGATMQATPRSLDNQAKRGGREALRRTPAVHILRGRAATLFVVYVYRG